ncbi:vacuolar protein sorting-associated protein 16 homolog [Acanthaster planci]|uniref:Vacuolar protein sorting-associated protein 16 homolog n=1 Tax=Acanthaster planci TaxID=133434 RepID=A0A8B7Z4H0_ACAPL|nr:vacuolar protein sorting-associated protein 16 homolog [Acanthaster planci]
MAHVSGDWNPLGEVFYRKLELYSMDRSWQEIAELKKFKVAAAPYGGPIALVRDESKMTHVRGGTRPTIYIYTSSGREISQFRWDSGKLLHMGWSSSEDLLCVQEDGTALVYDIFGSFKRNFSLGQEARDTKVVECKIFQGYVGTGLAILTGSYRFFVINNIDEGHSRKMVEVPGLDCPPSSWGIICRDRHTQILLAKEKQLFLVDYTDAHEQALETRSPVNAFIEMAVSFDNRLLALFADTGLLWIGSSDLQKVYCEFDTKSQVRPKQLAWCGTGAVVGYWENLLLVIGPHKDWIKFNMDSDAYLIPEVDGVRIVDTFTHELLQRVPVVVEEIFKIGSMAPGAMLFEASKEFQKESQRADEYIRMVKDQLPLAVDQAIEAAGCEYEPATQRMLLRAASFGKCFLTNMGPEKFVNMCKLLRVLNSVREYHVGMPLSYEQLKRLTLPVLIDRLILRRQWCLAMHISRFLKLPEADGESRILGHWACYKVLQKHIADEKIAQDIKSKLDTAPGIAYSEIAKKASECGRTQLAVRLLEYEPRAAEQVPLLMTMRDQKVALTKAIESGDTDLVYLVLLQMQETMPMGDFLMSLRNQPMAQSLFMQFCREQKPSLLSDLYYQNDDFQEMANCQVAESFKMTEFQHKADKLNGAHDNYTKARNEFAAKATEEQNRLLGYQRRLEEQYKVAFIGKSLHNTMHELVSKNMGKLAEQLRKEFKVPDKRFWWLKIDALANSGDWIELEKFAKSKKSPIGYEPFVEVCMNHHNKYEANKYIGRVAAENKVKMYIKMGSMEEAADLAFQQRSEEDLNQVMRHCLGNRALTAKIQSMKSQLAAKK